MTLLLVILYQACLDYFCSPPQCPNKNGMELREDTLSMIRFWQTMHSDKKHLKQSLIDQNEDITSPSSNQLSVQHQQAFDVRSTSSNDLVRGGGPGAGWANTVPLNNTTTLSKRTTRSKRSANPDVFVKDYIKKRNLSLSLLAVEVVRPILFSFASAHNLN